MADSPITEPVTPNSNQPDATPTPAPVTGNEPVVPVTQPQPTPVDKNVSKLIEQRDRNFEDAKTLQQELSEMREVMGDYLNEKAMTQAVADIQKDYPTVPESVIKSAGGLAEATAIAKAWTENEAKVKAQALKDLQNVEPNRLSREDGAAELKQLENSGNLRDAIAVKLRMKR